MAAAVSTLTTFWLSPVTSLASGRWKYGSADVMWPIINGDDTRVLPATTVSFRCRKYSPLRAGGPVRYPLHRRVAAR